MARSPVPPSLAAALERQHKHSANSPRIANAKPAEESPTQGALSARGRRLHCPRPGPPSPGSGPGSGPQPPWSAPGGPGPAGVDSALTDLHVSSVASERRVTVTPADIPPGYGRVLSAYGHVPPDPSERRVTPADNPPAYGRVLSAYGHVPPDPAPSVRGRIPSAYGHVPTTDGRISSTRPDSASQRGRPDSASRSGPPSGIAQRGHPSGIVAGPDSTSRGGPPSGIAQRGHPSGIVPGPDSTSRGPPSGIAQRGHPSGIVAGRPDSAGRSQPRPDGSARQKSSRGSLPGGQSPFESSLAPDFLALFAQDEN